LYQFVEDESVPGQTVKVEMVEVFNLADIEVIGSFCCEQDSMLSIVEAS
jgi:hypothetical protein